MVPPASVKISRVPTYSGYCYVNKRFHIRDYHPLWWNFPIPSIIDCYSMLQSTTPSASTGFALVPVRSPLLGESRLIYIPLGT